MIEDVKEGLTIVIPSKTEKFLKRTIQDVLEKADGPIHIYPVLDGYDVPDEEKIIDDRVTYIKQEANTRTQKRNGINLVSSISTNKFIMSLDAHCMMAPGFDTILKRDWQEKWVMIPRRHRLDAENWCLQQQPDGRPPIDYEYIMFRGLLDKNEGLHGFKWDDRTRKRLDIPIDDTITFQGSCWFMSKDWFKERGFMNLNYTGWGQEAEELSFETWKNGGRVVTDKNTNYAHLHKGRTYGRMYWMSREDNRRSYRYSFNKWVVEETEFFIELIKKFPRMPNWPDNWEEIVRRIAKDAKKTNV
jgi:hypothetical protein